MAAQATQWLRCVPLVGVEVLADWHLVPAGERRAMCGMALVGPVAVAILVNTRVLPEPRCARCGLWLWGRMRRN